jgi:hypothetical protein
MKLKTVEFFTSTISHTISIHNSERIASTEDLIFELWKCSIIVAENDLAPDESLGLGLGLVLDVGREPWFQWSKTLVQLQLCWQGLRGNRPQYDTNLENLYISAPSKREHYCRIVHQRLQVDAQFRFSEAFLCVPTAKFRVDGTFRNCCGSRKYFNFLISQPFGGQWIGTSIAAQITARLPFPHDTLALTQIFVFWQSIFSLFFSSLAIYLPCFS